MRVKRDVPINSIKEFHAKLEITGAPVLIPYSGNGCLAGVVKHTAIQNGAITSNTGTLECSLQWVPNGHIMTSTQLNTALLPDHPVKICSVVGGVITQGALSNDTFLGACIGAV